MVIAKYYYQNHQNTEFTKTDTVPDNTREKKKNIPCSKVMELDNKK